MDWLLGYDKSHKVLWRNKKIEKQLWTLVKHGPSKCNSVPKKGNKTEFELKFQVLLTQLLIPWQRSRMEVRPLKVSPSPAARPVPSGQADCVPKPLKVIIRVLKRARKLNREKRQLLQLSFLHAHESLLFCDDLLVFGFRKQIFCAGKIDI